MRRWLLLAVMPLIILASLWVSAQSAPTPAPTPSESRVIVADAVVRSGPGLNYVPVGQLTAGALVNPRGRNADSQWILIAYNRGYGWIRQDLAVWSVNITNLPALDESQLTPSPDALYRPTTAPLILAITATPATNWVEVLDAPTGYVRGGPGRTYLRLGQLFTGDTVTPMGRNADSSWVMIAFQGGFGWVRSNLVHWAQDINILPVLSADNLTPSPTFTPSVTATVTYTPSATATVTPSATPSATATETATATNTATDTPVPTATDTAQPTATETAVATATFTSTPLPTASETATLTETVVVMVTNTAVPTVTETLSPSATPSETATATEPATETSTATDTPVPTATDTALPTATNTALPTATETPLPSATFTPTMLLPTMTEQVAAVAVAATQAETATPVPSDTPSPVPSATFTPEPSATDLPTQAPTNTATPPPQASVTNTVVLASSTPLPPTASATSAMAVVVASEMTLSATAEVLTATPPPSATNAAASGNATTAPTSAPVATFAAETGSTASAGGLPVETLVGGVVVLGVLAYILLYWRGLAAAARYKAGFFIETCPVCGQGDLTSEPRMNRLFGVPRPRHTVRCDHCRSVLREMSPDRWRYTIDPAVNPALYRQYNGKELDEAGLRAFAHAHPIPVVPIEPRSPVTPPSFTDDDAPSE